MGRGTAVHGGRGGGAAAISGTTTTVAAVATTIEQALQQTTVAAMATVAAEQTAMSATTTTAAIAATTAAIAITSVAAVAGYDGVVGARQGQADHREEDRDAKNQCSIHLGSSKIVYVSGIFPNNACRENVACPGTASPGKQTCWLCYVSASEPDALFRQLFRLGRMNTIPQSRKLN